ncbi:MAG: hypothetical protein VX278_11245 [Myxococcota bacterium]|nr:hypothetical protein [Myxococcota bacterium]
MKKGFWIEAKELARPIISYWLLLSFSMFCFFTAEYLTSTPGEDDALFRLVFILCTVVPIVLGQAVAIVRFREVLGCVHGFAAFFLFLMAVWMGAGEVLGLFMAIYMLIGSIMFFAGMWSIQAGRALWASWPALIYSIGSVIVVINRDSELLDTWKSGGKWMIWNGATLTGFAITIVLLMAFLIIRENHRLFRWRNGPRTTVASTEILQTESKARLSMRGWFFMIGLASFLSICVAFLSPYLWQTAPADGDGQVEASPQATQTKTANKQRTKKEIDCSQQKGCTKHPDCREQSQQNQSPAKPPPDPQSLETYKEAGQNLLNLLWLLFITIILALLSYLFFGRPLRRVFLVRHYREPLWPISATKRIENQWKLIQIALGDIGVHTTERMSAMALAEDALPKLKEFTGNARKVPGLVEAAQIRDRVVFGLGLSPNDAEKMKEHSNWVYDSVWNRLGNRGQIESLYRKI